MSFFYNKVRPGGSGLGLASAYGIIRNHGGAIEVYSEPGKGTTFTISLPSIHGKQKTEEQKEQYKDVPAGKGCILIVEDEPVIMETAASLHEVSGYTVYRAANGQEDISVYNDRILILLFLI